MSRADVDLLVRPLARVDVGAFAEQRDPLQVKFAAPGDPRIDRALGLELLVPDELGGRAHLEERAFGDRHPDVHLRNEGEGEVGLLFVAVHVEYVAVDPQLDELNRRLCEHRSEAEPCALACVVDRHRRRRLRRNGSRDDERDHERSSAANVF